MNSVTVRDLTPSFLEHVKHSQDRESYEAAYPALFDHYFTFWCPRAVPYSNLPETELRRRADLLRSTIEDLAPVFADADLGLEKFHFVLFVGGNTSNGHAFWDGERMIVWLPVETYATDVRARIFVAHECLHALHYEGSPGFYFADEQERLTLGRQLITEGLATYLTVKLLGVSDEEALWADYLAESAVELWMCACRDRSLAIRSLCKDYLSSTWGAELFMANDASNIMRYRAGYYIGLNLVRDIAERERWSPVELLRVPRRKFKALAVEQLGLH